jgi:phage baseplate assembly protein W
MALRRITPGLTDTTLVTKKQKFFSDLDLNFTAKVGIVYDSDGAGNLLMHGDIYKKSDVAAITQSITTILLTNTYEKPFKPNFGANLRSFLFETMESYSESIVSSMVQNAIERQEPRVEVQNVVFTDLGSNKVIPVGASSLGYWKPYESSADDRYALLITVVVKILNTQETVSIDVNMNRLR